MPPVVPTKPNAIARFFYCGRCGAMWFQLPPDKICLMCKTQNQFKRVDLEVPSAQEALAT